MSSMEDELVSLIAEAAELFGWEDLSGGEVDLEITEAEDFPRPYTDIPREESEQVFRFFVTEEAVDLTGKIASYFDMYRLLEADYDETELGTILCFRSVEDVQDFWYIARIESGEVGLFHSDLSVDEEEDDEGEDLNGKGI
jgi:hypothetical protein